MADQQSAGRGIVSRRNVLKGAGATAFAAASLGVLPLFSTPNRKQDPTTCRAADLSSSQHVLDVSS